ncbi:conserved hypothetical protein [Ricinus communis]|uniref:Uncharacterized protein n=1 Tax=Ricinus communis TaxID=3988 RepID=B9SYH2_RICCO|nr:conserved hypothetical protein [Ricinus communis]
MNNNGPSSGVLRDKAQSSSRLKDPMDIQIVQSGINLGRKNLANPFESSLSIPKGFDPSNKPLTIFSSKKPLDLGKKRTRGNTRSKKAKVVSEYCVPSQKPRIGDDEDNHDDDNFSFSVFTQHS